MAAKFENTETAITLWVAFCSNSERSLDACAERTKAVLAMGDTEFMAEWLGREMYTVYLNRGRDAAFMRSQFTEDSPALAMGCVKATLDARMQGDEVDIESIFVEFAARYGECPALLTAKLRWLTLYINYPENKAEVERIMAVLASTPEATL